MTPFAIVLFAFGLADLIAGFSGRPRDVARSVWGWGAGVGAGVAMACLLGFETRVVVLVGAIVVSLLPGWLWVRSQDRLSVRRGALGFWSLVLVFVGLIVTGSLWPATDYGHLGRWVGRVPLQGFDESVPRVVLCAASVMFLLATANGLVRLILAMSGASPYQERRLRGGRMIGPLERLLIFGFVVAGQITAAALVVSAKTLLRFPEASRQARGQTWESQRLNEYLVVGSLSSWALAILAAALLRASAGT